MRASSSWPFKNASDAGIIDRNRVVDTLVMRISEVNPPTSSEYWTDVWPRAATQYVQSITNLLEVNRPGIDRATLAGIDAATHGAPVLL